MFEEFDDAAVVEAIGDSARAENIACARRLTAIAELYERRQIPVEDGAGRELWRIDPWEAVAAEVAAAQGITAAAAAAQLHDAICLRERLPKVAALFATGAISHRTIRMIVARTLLALEPHILAAIDAELAETLTTWGPLSFNKTEQAIDTLVERHDPAARRRTESVVRTRYIDVEHRGGIASLSGEVYSTDATLLDRRLTTLAHTVCGNDPRTIDQRRADALGALAAGHTTLSCACGTSDCAAAENPATASVVVHVVAEKAALDAADTTELHGEQPGDGGPEIVRDPERLAELIREAADPRPIPQTGSPTTDRAGKPGLVRVRGHIQAVGHGFKTDGGDGWVFWAVAEPAHRLGWLTWRASREFLCRPVPAGDHGTTGSSSRRTASHASRPAVATAADGTSSAAPSHSGRATRDEPNGRRLLRHRCPRLRGRGRGWWIDSCAISPLIPLGGVGGCIAGGILAGGGYLGGIWVDNMLNGNG